MTELEKIEYAKSFIDKLANGINPLDDSPIPDNDITNNVRLSRCFFYVSDILRQVIENGGTTSPKKKAKNAFNITQEQLSRFSYSETPISISEIAKKINDLVDTEHVKQLSYRQLTAWLIGINALAEQPTVNGKTQKRPTETGRQLGISLETRNGMSGEYQVVVYNKDAQMFILDNIGAIISLENK
jgi:hypothetical protein